ncbi:Man1b1 [Symbiodinium microadriaticum]|nr:Man1b1 [Symbiodinium microadriaticum]
MLRPPGSKIVEAGEALRSIFTIAPCIVKISCRVQEARTLSTVHPGPCKPRLGEWSVEDVVHWSLTTTLSPEVASWLRKHEVSGAVLRTLDEAEDAAKEKKANGPSLQPLGSMPPRTVALCHVALLLHGKPTSGFTKVEFEVVGPQNERQESVAAAFLHAWNAYKVHCWGQDELRPVTQSCSKDFGGLGVQIIDALDSLWLLGLQEDYCEAERWVLRNFTSDLDVTVSVFETVIRVLGGLLSAYGLSGQLQLLAHAAQLGQRLLRAWREGPVPHELVNLKTGQTGFKEPELGSTLAEVGTIQGEFTLLSAWTGDPTFRTRGNHVMDLLGTLLVDHGGLLPIMIHPQPPMHWTNARVTLGGRGDSFYEYLLKQWLITNRTEEKYRSWYQLCVDGIRRAFVGQSRPSNFSFIREVSAWDSISQLVPLSDRWQWDPETTGEELSGLAFFFQFQDATAGLQDEEKSQASASSPAPTADMEGVRHQQENGSVQEPPLQNRSQPSWAYIIIPSMSPDTACALMELLRSHRWDVASKMMAIVLPPPHKQLSASSQYRIDAMLSGQLQDLCHSRQEFKMDHLSCFFPGVLALGVLTGAAAQPAEELLLAQDLTESCTRMWLDSPRGLAPESVLWNRAPQRSLDFRATPKDAHCSLRPEVVESLWYLYLATGDPKYQDWGWSIFQAIEAFARVDSGGYSSIQDVTVQTELDRRDEMQTFLLSETFKYLFLLFGDKQILDLNKTVLNTEGHPLPVLGEWHRDAENSEQFENSILLRMHVARAHGRCRLRGWRGQAISTSPLFRASEQLQRQRRRHLHEVFSDSHKESHLGKLDDLGRDRYANASLEKAGAPGVIKGLSWCKSLLLQREDLDQDDEVRLLDIGSCNNALESELTAIERHQLRITAVDVCPRHDSVWQCDFLQLQVLPRHKRALREGRQLLGLPAESFDACLLSMVLHHWPQEVQQKALDTVHRLLVREGQLLVVENRAWDSTVCLSHAGFALEQQRRFSGCSLRGLAFRASEPAERAGFVARTDPTMVKSKTSRHALKCDKDFEPSPCLPTPLRSLLKSTSAKGLQDVTSPAVKLKQPIAYELQDSPSGTEPTLPASEAVAPTRAKAVLRADGALLSVTHDSACEPCFGAMPAGKIGRPTPKALEVRVVEKFKKHNARYMDGWKESLPHLSKPATSVPPAGRGGVSWIGQNPDPCRAKYLLKQGVVPLPPAAEQKPSPSQAPSDAEPASSRSELTHSQSAPVLQKRGHRQLEMMSCNEHYIEQRLKLEDEQQLRSGPDMKELIYHGVSHDHQGRRAYLQARRRLWPQDRLPAPVTSAAEVGWRSYAGPDKIVGKQLDFRQHQRLCV